MSVHDKAPDGWVRLQLGDWVVNEDQELVHMKRPCFKISSVNSEGVWCCLSCGKEASEEMQGIAYFSECRTVDQDQFIKCMKDIDD